jgi:hypothetical protein
VNIKIQRLSVAGVDDLIGLWKQIQEQTMANQPKRRLPPHVYQTADDVYRAMMRGMENYQLVRTHKSLCEKHP